MILAGRSPSSAAALLAAVGCALAQPSTSPASVAPGSSFTVLQANLCLSGLAGCYGRTAYPAIVEDTVSRIRHLRPDAVTLNEACRRDAQLIARRTGYHLRFASTLYLGEPFHCIQPDRRGLFGDAVLTKAAVDRADRRDFVAQSGPERRRWLCVATRIRVAVCTAHLETSMILEAPTNDAQCSELAALLARRAAAGTVIFGGDLNRRSTCAPAGMWTRTDTSAGQAPGLQHVSGSDRMRSPAADVVPAAHTDHDFLVVHARLAMSSAGRATGPPEPAHLSRSRA